MGGWRRKRRGWLNLFNDELSVEVLQWPRSQEGGEEGGRFYLTLHCHHQNDSCVKTGTEKSHFNVSLIAGDKATRQCPRTTAFEVTRHGMEPKFFCLPA